MAQIISYVLLTFFILFTVHFNIGSSQLFCWKCDPCPEPHSNTSSSVSVATCTVSQTICVKNTIRILGKTPQISKGCVQSCTPSSSNFFGQGSFVDCCNTNYCNFSTRNQLSSIFYFIVLILCTFTFWR